MKAEINPNSLPVIVIICLFGLATGRPIGRGWRAWRASALIGLLACLFPASASAAPDPSLLRIRAHSSPEEPVWVGEQVNFYVTVLMATRPKGSPTFQVLDVSGGILQQIPSRPLYGTEEIDGIQFTTWMYSFALYPHRAGMHTIPPIRVKVSLADANGKWQQLSASTDPFNIASRLPAGAEGLATLISSTEFEAHERWDPVHKKIKVGAAITRTITMRAANFLGMGFPPISFQAAEGVGVYPKLPGVNDAIHRGDISGERIETVVYIFEREGQYTLPGLSIPWFDISTNELKQVSFPPRRLEVAPNPAFVRSEQKNSPPDSLLPWRVIVIGMVVSLIAVAIVLVFAHRFRESLRRQTQKIRLYWARSEPHLFRQLLTAAKANDARAIVNRSTRWLHSSSAFDNARTLTAFATRSGDKEFQSSVTTLMQSGFGGDAVGRIQSMRPDPTLIKGLKTARNKCLHRQKTDHQHLPPINPVVE